MIERRDENTPENASGIAQQIAQTLELAFADEGASVTISGHHVYLEVPCPSRAVDDALRIHWWYDEVLLSFDNFHADFGPSGSFSDEDSRDKAIAAALDEAIATAREFLAERQVVITWYREGQVAVARREVPEGAMTAVHKDGKKLFGPWYRIRCIIEVRWPRVGRAATRPQGVEHLEGGGRPPEHRHSQSGVARDR
jgi:hypothetical protein